MHGVLKKEHQVSQNFVRIERTRFKIILLNIFTVKQLRASLVQMQFVALMAFTRKVVLSRCEHCLHCLNYLHCQIALAAFVHCLIACHFRRWFQSAHCDLKGPRVPSPILCLETSTLLLKQTLNSLRTNSQCEPSADNSKPKSNLLLDGLSNKRTEKSKTK